MANRMSGKIALITGGGGGIGAAVGTLFCAEGGRVVLFDRDAEILNGTAAQMRAVAKSQVETYVGDVSDPEHAARAVAHAVKCFGGLNVLVNNAAVRNHSSVAD